MIMNHVNSTNYYRKQLPHIVKGEVTTNDQSNIMQEKLKEMAPVPLPPDIRRAQEHDNLLELKR